LERTIRVRGLSNDIETLHAKRICQGGEFEAIAIKYENARFINLRGSCCHGATLARKVRRMSGSDALVKKP
jgi:UDP-3-O-acyl-N-acetylglucosamine deacetylase